MRPLIGPESFGPDRCYPQHYTPPSLEVRRFTIKAIMVGEAKGPKWEEYFGDALFWLVDACFGEALCQPPNAK